MISQEGVVMLSRQTFETILDLIENKMSCMEGWDQATSRERAKLEACRRELIALHEPKARGGASGMIPGIEHQA